MNVITYDLDSAESNGKANGTRNETGFFSGWKEFRDLGAQKFHGLSPRGLVFSRFYTAGIKLMMNEASRWVRGRHI